MSRPASAEQEEKASSAMPATEVGRVRAERLDAGSVCEHRGREGGTGAGLGTGTGTGFGIQVGVWRRNASHTGPDGQPAYRYIHTVPGRVLTGEGALSHEGHRPTRQSPSMHRTEYGAERTQPSPARTCPYVGMKTERAGQPSKAERAMSAAVLGMVTAEQPAQQLAQRQPEPPSPAERHTAAQHSSSQLMEHSIQRKSQVARDM